MILTDRGTEFSYPSRIEECGDGTKRTRVFFCDPMNSNQKSQLEGPARIIRQCRGILQARRGRGARSVQMRGERRDGVCRE